MSRLLVIIITAVLVLVNCAPSPVTGGGGASETVASLTPYQQGVRISVAGNGTFRVTVEIFHDSFSAVDTEHFSDAALITNDASAWSLPVLPESTYTVFLADSVSGNAAFFRYDNTYGLQQERQTKKMTPRGGVSGIVTLLSSDGSREPARGYRVVVYGSYFFAQTSDDGSYLISGIPEGNYYIEAITDQKMYSRKSEPDTIEISGERIYSRDLSIIISQ